MTTDPIQVQILETLTCIMALMVNAGHPPELVKRVLDLLKRNEKVIEEARRI